MSVNFEPLNYNYFVHWTYNIPLDLSAKESYEQWRYHCVDLSQFILQDTTDKRLSGGRDHVVTSLLFYRAEKDFWIDEVSIHQGSSIDWQILTNPSGCSSSFCVLRFIIVTYT